jgi:FkbM family methyltransferase
MRHCTWQFRKILNLFPCTIYMGDIPLWVPNRTSANGSLALANAMGYYDPNNMLFIEEIFKRDVFNTFLDVGSNLGFYSLIAAHKSRSLKVFAFEPHPDTFLILKENVRINQDQEKIFCYQIALGSQNAPVLFRDIAWSPENQVVVLPTNDVRTIEVMAHRGDDFCRQMGISPQIIKIDVEGYENHVLEGFSSIIKEAQLIFVECWEMEKTISILCHQAGFHGPYKIDYKKRRFTKLNCNYEDWIFVNPEAVSRIESFFSFQ